VDEHGEGHEQWNFLPTKGRCFGYVRTINGGDLKLERLGGHPRAKSVDNITVVFTATRPKPTRKRVVVGWYRNASVWRKEQWMPRPNRSKESPWRAVADEQNCRLLGLGERVFEMPPVRGAKVKAGRGVRYYDEPVPEAADFVEELRAYIDERETAPPPKQNDKRSRSAGRQSDPERRILVEKAAVNRVRQHYERMGYRCTSVEKDNVGWDLEFDRDTSRLRDTPLLLVEVKGCSGDAAVVELTPNEFKAMQSKEHRDRYRLAIVTNALGEPPNQQLRILAYRHEIDGWFDDTGQRAEIESLEGARVSCP